MGYCLWCEAMMLTVPSLSIEDSIETNLVRAIHNQVFDDFHFRLCTKYTHAVLILNTSETDL